MADLPEQFRLIEFDQITSTNDEAKRLAIAGKATHGTVIVAGSQTAGRGRLDREWVSEPGNLFCSIVLQPDCPLAAAPQLSFVSVIALFDTIRPVINEQTEVWCKWPNDLLVEKGKVAGILLESGGNRTKVDWVVTGCGLNIKHAPSNTAYPASFINKHTEQPINLPDALISFCTNLNAWYHIWQEQGFTKIRDAWLSRAHPIGQIISIRQRHDVLTGAFKGLDETGALMMDVDGTERRIEAGDLYFPV